MKGFTQGIIENGEENSLDEPDFGCCLGGPCDCE
jgi:hypothetical protein